MKKEQSIINKDDFFAGKLTENQEKQFRNQEDDSFFETLREEKEVKMELNFDDFMKKVEEKQPEIVNESKGKEISLWKISGIAASILIVFGMLFFLNQSNSVENNPMVVKTVEPGETTKTVESVTVKENVNQEFSPKEVGIKEEVAQITKITKSIKKENKTSTIQLIHQETTKPESAEEYSSDFVLVNGEPVENVEEATTLAYNTMKLFSKNVNQGAEAIAKLKSLSVEL